MRAILLPGMDGTGGMLTEFAAALAPRFQPTIVSYPKDAQLGYTALASFVWERLPRDEPFTLIAESFSGPVAIGLAAMKPVGLSALVLCASFAKAPRPRLRPFLPLLAGLPLHGLPPWLYMPLMMDRWATDEWMRRGQAAIRSVDEPVLRHRMRELATVDVTSSLARLGCPLLYLQASHDRLVPAGAWNAIRDAEPNAVRVEIEGPHFLLQAKPRECAAAIERAIEHAIER